MVVVCRWCPTFGDEEAWTKDLLADKRPDLDPYPADQKVRGIGIVHDEENVVGYGVKVQDRSETQNAFANDKLPAESFPTVAEDITADLRNPKRYIDKGKQVAVDAAEGSRPGCGIQG